MKVLVTGGAGYIGSHTVLELLEAGHEAVVLDNFSNSSPRAVRALGALANRDIPFVEGDVRDGDLLDGVFGGGNFDAVIHFAALKAVGESVAEPLRYFVNNVTGTAGLLEAMTTHGVRTLVFSSSATVYAPSSAALTEESPAAPASPYGRTKHLGEELLRDLHVADRAWRISCLRYFNAVGAHRSGLIGEDPIGVPRNLLPYIAQVAVGRRETPRGVRRRLSDAGRHVHSRLPARRGSRQGACPRARLSRPRRRVRGAQPRDGTRPQRAGGGPCLQAGERSIRSVPGRVAAAGRRTLPVRRSVAGAGRTRLDRAVGPRSHLRRSLALAVVASERVRGLIPGNLADQEAAPYPLILFLYTGILICPVWKQ